MKQILCINKTNILKWSMAVCPPMYIDLAHDVAFQLDTCEEKVNCFQELC